MTEHEQTVSSESASKSAWCFAMATKAHVVIDCAAYFAVMQEAMIEARQRIHLIGWDVDTRVRLGTGRRWWNKPSKVRQIGRAHV